MKSWQYSICLLDKDANISDIGRNIVSRVGVPAAK
jgi:hypothetical protein